MPDQERLTRRLLRRIYSARNRSSRCRPQPPASPTREARAPVAAKEEQEQSAREPAQSVFHQIRTSPCIRPCRDNTSPRAARQELISLFFRCHRNAGRRARRPLEFSSRSRASHRCRNPAPHSRCYQRSSSNGTAPLGRSDTRACTSSRAEAPACSRSRQSLATVASDSTPSIQARPSPIHCRLPAAKGK